MVCFRILAGTPQAIRAYRFCHVWYVRTCAEETMTADVGQDLQLFLTLEDGEPSLPSPTSPVVGAGDGVGSEGEPTAASGSVDDAQAVDDMEAGLAPPAAGAVVVDEPGGAPPVVDGDIFPEEFRVLYVERLRMHVL